MERNSVSDHTCGAIPIFESDHVRVTGNSISGGNEDAPFIPGEASGVGLFSNSHDNTVAGNTVSGNGFVGMIIESSDRNEVSGNRIFKNADGMIVNGDANTVSRNRISDALGARAPRPHSSGTPRTPTTTWGSRRSRA